MVYGWDECLSVLNHLNAALIVSNRDTDPWKAIGKG